MRAVVIEKFGPPEVMEIRSIEPPRPGPGEVLIRVVVSGVNPVDYKVRASGTWANIPFPAVIGYDASGVVEETGPGVRDLAKGDEVYFTPEIFGNVHGSYAEYTVARADIVARKPAGLSHEEAAAIPLAGGTAWEAVIRRLRIQLGETILVHGGAGGVGHFAVQFARAAGARVLATAGPENQAFLRELGADVPIDYKSQDVAKVALDATGGVGVDAVFDTVGGEAVGKSLPALRAHGRIGYIVNAGGNLGSMSGKNATLHGIFLMRESRRLEEMRPVFERKLARPVIAEVLPLEKVAEAHRRLESGRGRGKVVLRVAK